MAVANRLSINTYTWACGLFAAVYNPYPLQDSMPLNFLMLTVMV